VSGVTERGEKESDDAGEGDGFVDDVAGNLLRSDVAEKDVAGDGVEQRGEKDNERRDAHVCWNDRAGFGKLNPAVEIVANGFLKIR
jgi:hypothetical protein